MLQLVYWDSSSSSSSSVSPLQSSSSSSILLLLWSSSSSSTTIAIRNRISKNIDYRINSKNIIRIDSGSLAYACRGFTCLVSYTFQLSSLFFIYAMAKRWITCRLIALFELVVINFKEMFNPVSFLNTKLPTWKFMHFWNKNTTNNCKSILTSIHHCW